MKDGLNKVEVDERGVLRSCPQCGRRNRMTYEQLGEIFRCGNCRVELAPPNEPIELQADSEFDPLISHSRLPVLVDFWAPWCGPCKAVAPELVKVAAEGAGKWLVAKVNTEELPGLAQRFGVSAIPTLLLFKSTREVARQAGAMPAAAIRRFIERSN